MYDLMICEDKPVILMGLKKLISGFDLPIGEIYLAEDGQQALQIFSEHNIDLVVTDIRMPGCDGLSLIHQLQQQRSGFQCIIISGYNDFSYAKTAIHLGIDSYLLKPVETEELRASLVRCIDKLTRNVSQKQILSGILLNQMQEAWGDALPGETVSLLLGTQDHFFRAAPYGLLAFHLNSGSALSPKAVRQKTAAFLTDKFTHFLLLPVYERFFCVVINLSDAEKKKFCALRPDLEVFLSRLKDNDAAEVYCGISLCANSIFELKDIAVSAERALANRFLGKKEFAFSQDSHALCSAKNKDQILQHCTALCQGLRLPEIQTVQKECDILFAKFNTVALSVQTIPDCLRNVDTFIHQELADTSDMFSILHICNDADTLEQLKDHVTHLLMAFCRQRLLNAQFNQDPVSQAIEYMEKNYAKPLNLAVLANVVSLNYTYFSSIFKNRTGMTVTAYLQNLRIQKAKQLLISTDDKVCEIARKAGFTDARYFEKLFKNCENITPSEYRKQLAVFMEHEQSDDPTS
ncbi:MAG: response regulator [Lachnospiraceae bacterium]|nr:response regulator [Lachnospiraceae bacterium]